MTEFLRLGADSWQAIGTVATTMIAGAAAYIGLTQASESKKTRVGQENAAQELRKEQARPFVIVDFQPNSVTGHAVDLVIENMGNTLARNVRISFDPELATTDEDVSIRLPKSVLLTRGIPTLVPGQRIATPFDRHDVRDKSELPSIYEAYVEFDDSEGIHYKDRYTLDLTIRHGLLYIQERGMHDAAKALMEISKWGKFRDRLHVWVHDDANEEAARAADLKQHISRMDAINQQLLGNGEDNAIAADPESNSPGSSNSSPE